MENKSKLVIRTKIDKDNPNQKFVHVYSNKLDKMPFKGTSFNVNTKMSVIVEWANKDTEKPTEFSKIVLICNNCKSIHIAPKYRCECGSTTLTETHPSNIIVTFHKD